MNRRLTEFLGMILIGDGLLNVLHPRRHTALWTCGPRAYQQATRKLQNHPAGARTVGLFLIGLGLCLGRNASS